MGRRKPRKEVQRHCLRGRKARKMWDYRQVHVVISLSKPIAYATLRVNPKVNMGVG